MGNSESTKLTRFLKKNFFFSLPTYVQLLGNLLVILKLESCDFAISPSTSKKFIHTFQANDKNKIRFFCAASKEELNEWKTKLSLAGGKWKHRTNSSFINEDGTVTEESPKEEQDEEKSN